MNYEEKYKQALEKVKGLLKDQEMALHAREKLANVFPELAESEDEKIRKCVKYAVDKLFLKEKIVCDVHKEDVLAWLEKQGEQKTIDKTKTKFKVGDWITDGYVGGLITSIEDNYPCYKIADFMGGINTSIPFTLQDNYHLWTIEDAKDGDVLVDGKDGRPFIFTGKFDTLDDNPIAYCGINSIKKFMISSGSHWTFRDRVKPATKEQRDLLFKKIHDAGYEWDAEKKGLTIKQFLGI